MQGDDPLYWSIETIMVTLVDESYSGCILDAAIGLELLTVDASNGDSIVFNSDISSVVN